MSKTDKNGLLELLVPVEQEQLLRFWDNLTESEQTKLATQIQSIDWKNVCQWVKEAGKELSDEEKNAVIPAPYMTEQPAEADKELYARAIDAGLQLLKNGKVSAFTVAGGQGTRLGYDGPKGTYRISPLQNKSLFKKVDKNLFKLA